MWSLHVNHHNTAIDDYVESTCDAMKYLVIQNQTEHAGP